ncbi:hypothetical protein [Streptomyces sp. AP-93]|uniref:hypothetical protein n=1 Tax=Streptomyces sp. AP-93 TaxID=2929048 RepID=UPI001FAE908B|nr:hypothetical protein [Streptomyces sp. AP-93]MCJ0868948.1 hypothetical protein [Streptomyces sp. AP-93]
MATQDAGPTSPPSADLESLKAEWSRLHAQASAEALRYETLLESAREIEEIANLWHELATGPVTHPAIRETAQDSPPDATPDATAGEADVDIEKVLLLMAQEPHRLWRAKDVQAACAHPSLMKVRNVLKTMVADGRLEEVRRKARHLLFRIPAAIPDSAKG